MSSMSNNKMSKEEETAAIALITSIVSCVTWILPILGIPMSTIALIFSYRSINTTKGQVGLSLSILSLTAAVVNSVIGAIQFSQNVPLAL